MSGDSRPIVRGPFRSTLIRYPGKGGWTFAPIPKKWMPPVVEVTFSFEPDQDY
jgi:hypothetical protein